MGTATAPVPKRWNLRGIPVFQAEVPGRVRAALCFRVGTADEPLHMAGITHLIEHLALSGPGTQSFEYNGFVDNTVTAFLVSGTPEQVKMFFAHVTAALQALPRERVAVERRIIETEAAGHRQSSFRGTLSLRYGAGGFGAADYRQIGMMWLTPEAVQTWAARHFTAGNVAAWVAGPVIPGLHVDLPPGPRIPPPALVARSFPVPCVTEDGSLGATVSMVSPRSAALAAAMAILERRGMQRIRFTEGLSYGVQTNIDELDGRTVHALATTDALPEHATKAATALLDVADVLSLSGPDPTELEFVNSAMEEGTSDPQSVIDEMQGMVRAELLGREPTPFEQRRKEIASLDSRMVAAALKVALDTAIVVIPYETQSPRPHYAPYARFDARPLKGRANPNAFGTGEQLVVGASGIAYCDPDRRAHNIPWPEVAVAARWDDGTRYLIARDGTEILFRPRAWNNPQLILAAIDTNTPRERVIQADTPSPSADMPTPPHQERRGSIVAGRAPILLVLAGLLIAAVAGLALLASLQR